MNFTHDFSRNLIQSLYKLYPENPKEKLKCVEIGSFEGQGSLIIYNKLCNHPESRLYCIDPFDDEYVKGNASLSFWNQACIGQYSRFKNNTQGLLKMLELKGTSDTMLPKLDDNSIDFAYVDGDHSPEQVYKDSINLFPKIRSGGIILFDDYLWTMNGIVTKLGIDKFLEEYTGKYDLLFKEYQLAIRKL